MMNGLFFFIYIYVYRNIISRCRKENTYFMNKRTFLLLFLLLLRNKFRNVARLQEIVEEIEIDILEIILG